MEHHYVVDYEDIRIRPLSDKDLELVRSWRNKDQIRKWFTHSQIITKADQKQWYLDYIDKEDDMFFIIEEIKLIQRPIGCVALYHMNKEEAEFGRFMIGETQAMSKGYGKKALEAMKQLAFHTLRLRRIYLHVLSHNAKAMKVYEKAGFKKEACIAHDNVEMIKMVLVLGDEQSLY